MIIMLLNLNATIFFFTHYKHPRLGSNGGNDGSSDNINNRDSDSDDTEKSFKFMVFVR